MHMEVRGEHLEFLLLLVWVLGVELISLCGKCFYHLVCFRLRLLLFIVCLFLRWVFSPGFMGLPGDSCHFLLLPLWGTVIAGVPQPCPMRLESKSAIFYNLLTASQSVRSVVFVLCLFETEALASDLQQSLYLSPRVLMLQASTHAWLQNGETLVLERWLSS